MAITRTRVTRALENYIPSSIAVSKDPKTNVADPEEAFKKLQTMVSVALVLDPNSLFYLLSIVLGEVLTSAEKIISGAGSLASQEVLLSAEQTLPAKISDTVDLLKASSAISDLATSSSSEASANLDASITSFQTNQLKSLVQQRNIKLVEDDIRSLASTMSGALEDVTDYLSRVTSAIDDYENIDVKAVALAHVAETARLRILQIKEEVEESSAEEQAALAEDILVDLAAAKVALTALTDAENPRGSIVVPATSDASTKQTYLAAQGTGKLIPRTYVAKGPSGRMFIDYVLASTQGTSSADEYEVTARLLPEDTVSFPLTVSSPGNLRLLVNGTDEDISFGATTFFSVGSFISYYNSVSTSTTAYETGDSDRPFAIYAYSSTGSNPVGADSTISVSESASASILALLAIGSTASSVGVLASSVIEEGSASLSSYTFPSTTTEFLGITSTSFDCTIATLDGAVRKINSIDTSTNRFTVSPPMPLAVVTDSSGNVTYEAGPFSYVVTKTATGSLFESGSGGNTTPLVDDPDGNPLDSFLLTSAGSTGATGSTRIQHPNAYVQASITLTINASSMTAGDSLTVGGVTLTAVSAPPTSLNTFEVGSGATGPQIADNITAAINLAENGFTEICTAETSGSQVILTAAYYPNRGTAGNSIAVSTTSIFAFGVSSGNLSGGETPGTTWDGLGEHGDLERILRISGSDGTNVKERATTFSTATVGDRKASGSAGGSNGGVVYKGYASGTSANWYVASDGEWGEKQAESSATIGAAASPSAAAPTNLFAFDSSTASHWTTDTSRVYWDGAGKNNIEFGHYFVMTAWTEYPASSNEIQGPYVGVGANSNNYPSPPHRNGIGGTTFFVNAAWNSTAGFFTITSPDVDENGDGTSDGPTSGVTWNEKGWYKSPYSGSAYLTMFGYVFDPRKFLANTTSAGFQQTYTTPSGASVTPQSGDRIFYEWNDGSTDYRNDEEIASVLGNLKLQTILTTADDFTYRIDDPWRAQSPRVRTGVKYTLVRDDGVARKRFFAKDVDLVAAGVVPGDLLYVGTSGSNQGWYVIESIASTNEAIVSATPSGTAPDGSSFKNVFSYPQNVDWEIRSATYDKRLTDTAAEFLTNGVQAGDTLTVISTSPSTPAFVGSFEVEAVESETSLRITSGTFDNAGSAGVEVTYRIPQNDSLGGEANEFFRSPSSTFYGKVFPGDVLTVFGNDYEVESLESSNILKINSYDSGPATFASYSQGEAFSIRRGPETSGTYSGQETTNAFKIEVSSESGLTDLKDIDGIEVSNQIDLNPSGTPNRKDGYLVIKEGDYAGTYPITSVSDLDGNYQYVYIGTYLPVDPSVSLTYSTSWEVIAGKTTKKFLDGGSVDRFLGTISSSSSFADRPPEAGDSFLIEFSDGSSSFRRIESVDFDDEVSLEEGIDQGLTSLRYSLLPAEFPQIGNELVVSGHRVLITDIRLATDARGTERSVLELESPLPLNLGSGLGYFVVTPGADPFSAFLEDSDPDVQHDLELTLTAGFKTPELGNLVGADIQVSDPAGSFSAVVDEVVNQTTLRLSKPVETVLGDVFYRVITEEPGKSSTLTHLSSIPTSMSSGDYLSIWQIPLYRTVSSKTVGTTSSGESITNINFAPQVASGLSSLDFAVTRGGASGYGKYLLLIKKVEDLNTRLNNYSFSDLNLRLAEVIADNGSDRTDVLSSAPTSSAVATAPDDGDGDDATNRFDVSINASQDLEGVKIGDRISLTYRDTTTSSTTTVVCWVTLQEARFSTNPLEAYDELDRGDAFSSSITRCLVTPEIPKTSATNEIVSWSIQRSSISFALNETTKLRLLAEEVRDIVELYSVESSANVDAALSLLESEGYDRLAALLRTGQLSEFFGTSYTSGTYQDLMTSTVREAGALLLELKDG